MMIDHKREMIN